VVRRDYFFADFLAAGFAATFAAGFAATFAAGLAAGLATAFAAGFTAAGLAAATGFAAAFFFAAIESHLPSMPKGHEWKIRFEVALRALAQPAPCCAQGLV
jgi:hypothetical protein